MNLKFNNILNQQIMQDDSAYYHTFIEGQSLNGAATKESVFPSLITIMKSLIEEIFNIYGRFNFPIIIVSIIDI